MVEIATQDDVRSWLADKPLEWHTIIAARAAARALPYGVSWNWPTALWDKLALQCFRGTFISWAASSLPNIDFYDVALETMNANYASDAARVGSRHAQRDAAHADYSSNSSALDAAYAADAASHAATCVFPTRHNEEGANRAAITVDYAANAAANEAAAIWSSVSADFEFLEHWGGQDFELTPAEHLAQQPLWRASLGESQIRQWRSAIATMNEAGSHWQVWIDWYERRLEGREAAFDIPGDNYRREDNALLVRFSEAKDADFWSKGAKFLNTELQRWIDEARTRIAPVSTNTNAPLALNEVVGKLAEIASPEAQIANGRLDAVPNARFDCPEFGSDLPSLPSELRAYIKVIREKLPRNVSREIEPLLIGYDRELEVRATRPILNILKAMAASLRAELWASIDSSTEKNPDHWVLRSPQEWGPGSTELWRTFFKTHNHLIEHFPLDAEREALIAATPIDEAAASGTALTEAVDTIADLILQLADRGLATPNIVRIIEAHQQYNRSIAGHITPEQSAQNVSPKRRHVLGTIAFWLNLLGVLSSGATLADSATVATLITYLRASITDWLNNFIIR